MDYSLLWLDWKRKEGLPEYTKRICAAPQSPQGRAALRELREGIAAMSGRVPEIGASLSPPCISLIESEGEGEEHAIGCVENGIAISGGGRGLLYGVFSLLRKLALGETIRETHSSPAYSIRMLDHWDNPDGSIERGYSGRSFFFKDGEPICTARTRDYARLLASCGLNGCCINNVNIHGNAYKLLSGEYSETLKSIGETLGEYGVSLWIAVSFASPMVLGGLDTADPLDAEVRGWWKETCRKLFAAVPNLAGFLIKADSEGLPGPHSYSRTQAEGANMIGEALEAVGGKLLWRCFVYNCTQDWRDTATDRARAQCDTFAPLDGQFRDNVFLQAKNGPVDFQIREPVAPVFGHLDRTNTVMEFQLAQEYTGQQRHVCYLLPMYREVLDFRLRRREEKDSVRDAISAISAVSNTGDDFNWTGHDLAAANLYGFGRLAWDPKADPETLAREWSVLTFGDDSAITEAVTGILMPSRETYEKYTTPMGIGWMVRPFDHYGPSPEGYEYDRWGTYHRATHREIGVERGPAGTGMTEQYAPELAALYGDPSACPEELLLFFHRLPFDYRMRDGRTLLQRWYDDHFSGYEEAKTMADSWDALEGRVPDEVFRRVQERFLEQLRCAREWRDIINSWLYRLTLVPDEQGREIYL